MKRARFYSAKDIAIFELQAFLQDLDIDSSGFHNETLVDGQEEHKDDYEEPRMTGAIGDVRCTPHDPVITKRATGSPVSPNSRISISPRSKQANVSDGLCQLKRVTKQANVSDRLRQMFVPFGQSDFAKETEKAKVTKDDNIQSQGCLISCFATSASKKIIADIKNTSKEVSFSQSSIFLQYRASIFHS
jgi:hypothetical protein